ncbi:MAG: hypothetical protein IT198_17375 [Acidimicrobiia bacterium]|nr:hypothetical protein [Acidimicrobiia bacterium]
MYGGVIAVDDEHRVTSVEEIAELQAVLDGFQRNLDSQSREYGWGPTADSRAYREGWDGDEPLQAIVRMSYELAGISLLSATQHLAAISRILATSQDDQLLYPIYTLARGAIEAAASAYWLLAPDEPGERARRGLAARLKGLDHQMQAVGHLKDHPDDPTQAATAHLADRRTQVAQAAAAIGEELHPSAFALKGRAGYPRLRDLVTALYRDYEQFFPNIGPLLYAFFSERAHGYPSALGGMLVPVTDADEFGTQLAQAAADIGEVAFACNVAATGVAVAAERRVELFGWNLTLWRQWRQHANKKLLEASGFFDGHARDG